LDDWMIELFVYFDRFDSDVWVKSLEGLRLKG
jgi:hypothetical protein